MTTLTQIKTFNFAPGMSLRTVARDGQPWFIAADVCAALDLTNAAQAVAELDPEDKHMQHIGLPGRAPWLVSEAGMYSLIFRSRKAEAKTYTRWVTTTVLPSIRKDGIYIANQEKPIADDLTLPDLLAQMADLQAKVDAIKAAKVLAWSRHQEEKLARREALRFLR